MCGEKVLQSLRPEGLKRSVLSGGQDLKLAPQANRQVKYQTFLDTTACRSHRIAATETLSQTYPLNYPYRMVLSED